MPSFHRDTVTVVRPTIGPNRYGDDVVDWSTPTLIDIPGCRVIPAAGAEMVVDRDQVIRRSLLFAPPSADIRATDRIRWQGADYDVDGDVRHWRGPSGALAHIEADLVRVEG